MEAEGRCGRRDVSFLFLHGLNFGALGERIMIRLWIVLFLFNQHFKKDGRRYLTSLDSRKKGVAGWSLDGIRFTLLCYPRLIYRRKNGGGGGLPVIYIAGQRDGGQTLLFIEMEDDYPSPIQILERKKEKKLEIFQAGG